MAEIWKAISGYEGAYEVSTLGRVRSLDKPNAKSGPRKGKLRKLVPIGADAQQYLSVMLSRNNVVRCGRVHVLVLETFVRPRRAGEQARHLNGCSTDNRLSNLAWGTVEQNTADKVAHGTVRRGEDSPNARMCAGDVLRVRDLRAFGYEYDEIAEHLGLTNTQVAKVVRRETWAHV